jgi:hypothetical protein
MPVVNFYARRTFAHTIGKAIKGGMDTQGARVTGDLLAYTAPLALFLETIASMLSE